MIELGKVLEKYIDNYVELYLTTHPGMKGKENHVRMIFMEGYNAGLDLVKKLK